MILIPKPKKRPWIVKNKQKFWGNKEDQLFYKSYTWRRIREDYLVENPKCVVCGRVANTVDHIIPIRNGGSKYRLDNLQSMCRHCHNSKTAKESSS